MNIWINFNNKIDANGFILLPIIKCVLGYNLMWYLYNKDVDFRQEIVFIDTIYYYIFADYF